MVLTCLLIFLIAVGYEGFKVCRQRHLESCFATAPEDTQTFIGRRFRKAHIIQSVLHIFQVAFGYILMLLAMTYNVWIFLAIVLGAGVGYFLFTANSRPNSVIIEEHCN
ncbi:high affinity copper uptake protein 1-like protein [Leptotrombidium deliense]|uniref:Copper transport protein n=1 Tax=Leptotrombidium deliense TaxID=299467 RepID=A0A443RXZ4_9ACAR|nr:high affinity copper uptake protein 1-like protein [Leptotrombidium deliense]